MTSTLMRTCRTIKEGFLTGIMAIIEEQLPEAYRKDFIEFMLG